MTLSDERRLLYKKLLIATGATPRRLPLPGADLDGVYSLRTLDDSAAIGAAAAAVERAVVVGGGFIGMEVAASLRQLGLEVTLVHMGRGLFDQLRSEALSAELLMLYQDTPRNERRADPRALIRRVQHPAEHRGQVFATALEGGILIDATIIRGILAPAVVALLGRWNWWLPDSAARLLRVEPSRADHEVIPETPAAAPTG